MQEILVIINHFTKIFVDPAEKKTISLFFFQEYNLYQVSREESGKRVKRKNSGKINSLVYSKDIQCLSESRHCNDLSNGSNHISSSMYICMFSRMVCTRTPKCIRRQFWQWTTGFGYIISISNRN